MVLAGRIRRMNEPLSEKTPSGQPCQLADLVEITTTVEHQADANRLATEIVSQRLAACVQISGPIFSVYQWKGFIHSGQEFGLKLKVASDGLANAVAFLRANHPYELPEIIVNQVKASTEYAQWINEQRQ